MKIFKSKNETMRMNYIIIKERIKQLNNQISKKDPNNLNKSK